MGKIGIEAVNNYLEVDNVDERIINQKGKVNNLIHLSTAFSGGKTGVFLKNMGFITIYPQLIHNLWITVKTLITFYPNGGKVCE